MPENESKKPKKVSNLLALVPLFKPYKSDIFLALLALLVTAFMVLFFGKAIKYLIDFGFVRKNQLFLDVTIVVFISAVAIMAIAGYYRSSIINEISERVISDLRKKVYNHIISVSAEFFELTKTGDVVSRLTVDTVVLYNAISNTSSFFLRNSILFVGGMFFLFLTSIKLSIVSFVAIALAVTPIILIGKRVKNLSNEAQAALASVGSHIEESLNGVKTIQSYLCEKKEAQNFSSFVDSALKISLTKIRIKSFMIALVITCAFGGVALVLWVGGGDVLSGKITSGDLSSFMFYSIISATSLVSLSQIAGQLQSASAAAGRVFELLEIESPVKESASPQAFPETKEITIKFQNVNFSYPSRKDISVLKNFDLEIKPCEKVAIVGSSGSGKSTVLQLLLRFYDVDSGIITLNGSDIRSLSFSDLRKNFSYISQDCFIFSGTVLENIAYVDRSTPTKEIEELISKNSAFDFINQLPQGIHNFVGEKGIKLSGGERQRIALARAIIKDSPILLLDEATSALDNQNEQFINRAITELARNKTVITIAHKLSSVISADRIIFIHDGKISEIGSHQDLIGRNGFYKKMYEAETLERA